MSVRKIKTMGVLITALALLLCTSAGNALNVPFNKGKPVDGLKIINSYAGTFTLYKTQNTKETAYHIYYPSTDQFDTIFTSFSDQTFERCSSGPNYGSPLCYPERVIKSIDIDDSHFQIVMSPSGIEKIAYSGSVKSQIKTIFRGREDVMTATISIPTYNACISFPENANQEAIPFLNLHVSDDECRFYYNENIVAQVHIGNQFVTPFILNDLTNKPISGTTDILRKDGQKATLGVAALKGYLPKVILTRLSATQLLVQSREDDNELLSGVRFTKINLPEPMFDVSFYNFYGAESIGGIIRLDSGKYLHLLFADSDDLRDLKMSRGMKVRGNMTVQPFVSEDDLNRPGVCGKVYSHYSQCQSLENL